MNRPAADIRGISWVLDIVLPACLVALGLCFGLALEGYSHSFSLGRVSFVLTAAAFPLVPIWCVHLVVAALASTASVRCGVRVTVWATYLFISYALVGRTDF